MRLVQERSKLMRSSMTLDGRFRSGLRVLLTVQLSPNDSNKSPYGPPCGMLLAILHTPAPICQDCKPSLVLQQLGLFQLQRTCAPTASTCSFTAKTGCRRGCHSKSKGTYATHSNTSKESSITGSVIAGRGVYLEQTQCQSNQQCPIQTPGGSC